MPGRLQDVCSQVVHTLRGDPRARGVLPIVTQLAGIALVLSYRKVALGTLAALVENPHRWWVSFFPDWWPDPMSTASELLVELGSIALSALACTLSYLVAVTVWRKAPLGWACFVRCLWRTLGWVSVVALLVQLSVRGLPFHWASGLLAAALGVIALAGPAWLARDELGTRRPSRWRPVCPECGYSLRAARGERCTECGQTFPTTQRVYRRWAMRRLPWDRAERGSWLFTYLNTVAMVLFCPCRAARGLAVSDRLPRALRFATVHVLLYAALGTLLGSKGEYRARMFLGFQPSLGYPERAPIPVLLAWMLESFVAWIVVLVVILAIAAALTWLVSGPNRAQCFGSVKWTCYSSVAMLPIGVAFVLLYELYDGAAGRWMPQDLARTLSYGSFQMSTTGALATYAGLWALGSAANPYQPRSGLRVAMRRMLSFQLILFAIELGVGRSELTSLL